jgi:hypothetical protein
VQQGDRIIVLDQGKDRRSLSTVARWSLVPRRAASRAGGQGEGRAYQPVIGGAVPRAEVGLDGAPPARVEDVIDAHQPRPMPQSS